MRESDSGYMCFGVGSEVSASILVQAIHQFLLGLGIESESSIPESGRRERLLDAGFDASAVLWIQNRFSKRECGNDHDVVRVLEIGLRKTQKSGVHHL